MMHISKEGLDFIKKKEGLRLNAYKCSAGVWTIGYGHTGKVYENQHITKEQADFLLRSDVTRFEKQVNRLVQVSLTQPQFDALVSFTFNLGGGALERSTLLKKLNKGNYSGAAKEFDKWVYANKKKLDGLVKRRAEERKMFEQYGGEYSYMVDANNTPLRNRELPLPQVMREDMVVTDKKPLDAQKVAVGSGLGIAGASAAIELANQAAPVASVLSYLDWRVGLAIVGVLAVGGVVWWIKKK